MTRLDDTIDELIGHGLPVGEAIQVAIDPDPAPLPDEHLARAS